MIVGQVNERADMIKGKLAGAPSVTYNDQMTIFLGGKEIDLRYFGRCHTDGDTFVYFPADKVIVTGDCFNTGNGRGLNPTGSTTPGFYADYTINGSVLSWPATVDAALRLDWDIVIPGHGPPSNRAAFLKWRRDVDTVIDRVRTMARAGSEAVSSLAAMRSRRRCMCAIRMSGRAKQHRLSMPRRSGFPTQWMRVRRGRSLRLSMSGETG